MGATGELNVAETVTYDTVRGLYAAYAAGDLDRLGTLLHADIDWVLYAPIALFPFAGPRKGRTAVLQVVREIGRSFAIAFHTIEVLLVDGDRAAIIADLSFKQQATGRMLRFRVANFLRFQDGQVIEFREFSNTFDVVEQTLGREIDLN